jgi:hypothetical protein
MLSTVWWLRWWWLLWNSFGIVAADQRWWVLVLFTRFETVEFPLLFFLPFLTRWKIC